MTKSHCGICLILWPAWKWHDPKLDSVITGLMTFFPPSYLFSWIHNADLFVNNIYCQYDTKRYISKYKWSNNHGHRHMIALIVFNMKVIISFLIWKSFLLLMCLILKIKQQHNQFTTILDIHIGIDNIRYIDTERDYEKRERGGRGIQGRKIKSRS